MSEKINSNWDAVKPGGEENNQEYLASIVKEINEINRKTGQPEVRLMSAEEARTGIREEELAKGREEALDRSREIQLATDRALDLENSKEMEQTRGLDVRRIMAEEAAKQEEATKKEREVVPAPRVIRQVSEFDPEMEELTIAKEPRKEIDVIGQGTEPVDQELAKKVEEIMALKKELRSRPRNCQHQK